MVESTRDEFRDSVLFADVRGSTMLSEQMSPLDFQRLINQFYVESTNAIIKEDGLVVSSKLQRSVMK